MNLHESVHLERLLRGEPALRRPVSAPPRPRPRRPAGAGRISAVLFLCLFAAQSGQIALTPVLTEVAMEFDLSTAGAGQIRTAAAVVAAIAALTVVAAARRVGLRTLLLVGMGLLAAGSALSVVAPSAPALAAGQALAGAASSLVVAAGIAAAAQWTAPEHRGRAVAWALVGAPTAWIVGMPTVGLLASASWRAALALPVLAAVVAALALQVAPATPPAPSSSRVRAALREPKLRRWAAGETVAYAAWGGALLYAGALLVESYDASVATVGIALGVGAAAYIPGTFAARAARPEQAAPLLVAAGAVLALGVTVFGLARTSVGASTATFATLCFLGGARTFLGSSVGLALAGDRHVAAMAVRSAAAQVGWVAGAAVGGAALALGGYGVLGLALAALFVAAAALQAAALEPVIRRARRRATRPAAPVSAAVRAR